MLVMASLRFVWLMMKPRLDICFEGDRGAWGSGPKKERFFFWLVIKGLTSEPFGFRW